MKKNTFFILPFVFFFLTSCDKTIDNMTNLQNRNIELAQQLFKEFNRHDWRAMANLYSDSAEFKDPSFGKEAIIQTREQIYEKYKELGEIFHDIQDKVINLYPSGDEHIIVEFISSGTAPDGSKLLLPICTILTFKNEIIIKDYTYYDNHSH